MALFELLIMPVLVILVLWYVVLPVLMGRSAFSPLRKRRRLLNQQIVEANETQELRSLERILKDKQKETTRAANPKSRNSRRPF